MKQLYILLIVLFSSQVARSQMYFQYFDGANTNPANSVMVTIQTSSTNIWQIGPPQKTLFSSASTTPNVIVTDTINYYPNKNKSVFSFYVKNPFFGGGGQILALRWKQKLDMDQGLDGGIVEYSANSGATWQNTFNNPAVYQYYGFLPNNKDTLPSGEFAYSGTDNVWRDIWLCLGPTVTMLNDTILYRFTFKSDSINTNKEGWMIDNLQAYYTIMHPVKQISQADYLNVYPSVTNNGIVNIEAIKMNEMDVIQSIELINSDGKIVERFGQNNLKTVIDISHHASGAYRLKVTTNVKTKTVPIVLEK